MKRFWFCFVCVFFEWRNIRCFYSLNFPTVFVSFFLLFAVNIKRKSLHANQCRKLIWDWVQFQDIDDDQYQRYGDGIEVNVTILCLFSICESLEKSKEKFKTNFKHSRRFFTISLSYLRSWYRNEKRF